MSHLSFYDIPEGKIPLYCKCDGDLCPRDASLILDPETAEVYFETASDVFQSSTAELVVSWSVDSRLTGECLEEIYQEIKPFLDILYNGLELRSQDWDTIIMLDDDAEDAYDKINEVFHNAAAQHTLLETWDVWDWCAETVYLECVSNVSLSTTNKEIATEIANYQSEFERDHHSILINTNEYILMLNEYRDCLSSITSQSTDQDIELIVDGSEHYSNKIDRDEFNDILLDYRDSL